MDWHLYCCLCVFVQVACKAVMVFFHYCVMSNYFWLFIEGLYLFTLLVETFFPERRYFYWYTIVGWGTSFHIFLWIKIKLEFFLGGGKWNADHNNILIALIWYEKYIYRQNVFFCCFCVYYIYFLFRLYFQ